MILKKDRNFQEISFFAMPLLENQIDSGSWDSSMEITHDIKANEPIFGIKLRI